MKTKLAIGLLGACAVALPAGAWTIHRSFTRRDVGFGSSASVSVPVDSRVSAAIDEGRRAAKKERSIIGRVTQVVDGDTLVVTPTGGSSTKVRLRNIDAPEAGQPGGNEATEGLKGLVGEKKVEVKYAERDAGGRVLGTVYLKTGEKGANGAKLVDVNLTMVLNGWAWNNCAAGTDNMATAYGKAEQAARLAKKGLWADEGPIRPSDWRKGQR